MQKKVLITQSNYIPWKGYFDSINQCDTFVIYDDMQYTKRDWRNRNLIKTPEGLKWLSIPVEVKGKYFQKINETRISDKNWNKSHLDILKQNYKEAKNYKEVTSWLEDLYMNCSFEFLTEVNQYFIEKINEYLGIKTEIKRSEEFILAEEKTQRLVNICKELNATDYYTGPSAKTYMNENLFSNENINIYYLDFSGYKEYIQLYPPFDHGVSILDLILNEGKDAKQFMKF